MHEQGKELGLNITESDQNVGTKHKKMKIVRSVSSSLELQNYEKQRFINSNFSEVAASDLNPHATTSVHVIRFHCQSYVGISTA